MALVRNFWLNLALVFVAMRLADAINAVTGLFVVPRWLGGEALGAVAPLTQLGAVLAFPVSVLTTVFSRHLCACAAHDDEGVCAQALLRDVLAATGVCLAGALTLVSAVMPWICETLRVPHSPAGYLAVSYGLTAAFVPMTTAALQAFCKFGAMSLASVLAAPARLVAQLVLLPLLGLTGYFLGQIVPLLVTAGVAVWALRRLLGGPPATFCWHAEARPMLRYAAKVAVGVALTSCQTLLAAFLIRTRLSFGDSAGYYIVSRFAEIATYCGSTVAFVLFPFATVAYVRGKNARRLHDGAIVTIVVGGCLLAFLLWLALPPFFRLIPLYAPYVPHAPLAAYLALTTTLNVACATHFTYQQARNDFRYLLYLAPCVALGSGALWLWAGGSLQRVLDVLFACAAAQALCVAAEVFLGRRALPPEEEDDAD